MSVNTRIPVIRLLIFIIDWTKVNVISSIFDEEKVRFHFVCKGRGTATSEILDLLGIGSSEKAVILCLEQEVLIPVLLKEVRKKLGFHNPGVGIAFTVPLSGINNPILHVFKESIHKNEKIQLERGSESMSSEIKNDLIVSIINEGYSDEFMSAAREAGATGGTVISARGLSHEGPVKFFGVSLQEEREIIIILTAREKKSAIMQTVSQNYGITTKAGGVIFSLPVDRIMGLSFE